MQSKFESYIKDNLPFLFKERSIVCCSAGIDSIVLFHLMLSINKNFVVAHCNYKLRADESDLDEVVSKFETQWKRLPTEEELTAIIEKRVEQEVFYQEALKMNLDHNDEI